MNHFLHGVTRAIVDSFSLPEPILEIGSFQVPGQESIANLRTLFPGKEYLGIDMRPGPGVDQVANVEDLPFETGTVGTVLALNTFEHVRKFWKGFDEIHRVLRPGGALVVSCPFFFRIHQYPSDYWRFTPSALDVLLEPYPHRVLGWHGARSRPANVWGVGFREKHPGVAPEQFALYQKMLSQYAQEPTSWSRRLRYRLASLLVGRGPFATYLDHDRWETELRTSTPRLNPNPRTKV